MLYERGDVHDPSVVLAHSDILNGMLPDEVEMSGVAVGILVSSVTSRIALALAASSSTGSRGGMAHTDPADISLAEAGVGLRGLGRWKAG